MRNLPYGFDIYLVKTIRQIAQIFVAFSEKLNIKVRLLARSKKILANPCPRDPSQLLRRKDFWVFFS